MRINNNPIITHIMAFQCYEHVPAIIFKRKEVIENVVQEIINKDWLKK